MGIYVLRSDTEEFPKRSNLTLGDIVIMKSGDIAVWVGESWDLLPGRYMGLEQLKAFVSYVGSGWPASASEAREDLAGRVSDLFLERLLITTEKVSMAGLDQSV